MIWRILHRLRGLQWNK